MTNSVRFTVAVPSELAARIDAYWHAHKLNNKGDAVRELIYFGLQAAPPPAPPAPPLPPAPHRRETRR